MKNTEIKSSILSDHGGIKLEIKEHWKIHKHMEIEQHSPEQSMDTRKNKDIRKFVDKNNIRKHGYETQPNHTCGMQQKHF